MRILMALMMLFTINTVKADTEIQMLLRAIKIPDGFMIMHLKPYALTMLGKSNSKRNLHEVIIYGELNLVKTQFPHPDGLKYNEKICGLNIIDITEDNLADNSINYFSSIRLLDNNFDTTELIIMSNESFSLRKAITNRLCEKG